MKTWSPFRSIVSVYIALILLGAIFLMLPQSSYGISFIDSLFTATSAVCVTGLIVKDTAIDFTLTGKSIILILIQIGGLGYMAFASLFMTMLGRRTDMKQELIAKEEFGMMSMKNVPQFLRLVVLTTFSIEIIGIFVLYFGFMQAGFPSGDAFSHAVFQSVSAFCNAGFSSFSKNLMGFENIPLIAWTIPALFITGGLGFIVLEDIYECYRNKTRHLSEHSRIVIITTVSLIVIGSVLILVLENGNMMSGKSISEKIIIAIFTATTPRTAGFSLINISGLLPASLLLLTMFMFIGASPGGTGGGIKTTTFMIINAFLFAKIRGQNSVNIEKRRISEQQLNKALTLFFISIILISLMIGILSFSEQKIVKERGLLPVIFEEFSAFGTVGLSMGSSVKTQLSLAHDFSALGKLLLVITMVAGRAGPLTLAAIVLGTKSKEKFKYPIARIQIG